jgi:hypothetical protein
MCWMIFLAPFFGFLGGRASEELPAPIFFCLFLFLFSG